MATANIISRISPAATSKQQRKTIKSLKRSDTAVINVCESVKHCIVIFLSKQHQQRYLDAVRNIETHFTTKYEWSVEESFG